MTLTEKFEDAKSSSRNQVSDGSEIEIGVADNTPALGKSFSLLSACSTGITTGNSWAVLGGGIVSITVVICQS